MFYSKKSRRGKLLIRRDLNTWWEKAKCSQIGFFSPQHWCVICHHKPILSSSWQWHERLHSPLISSPSRWQPFFMYTITIHMCKSPLVDLHVCCLGSDVCKGTIDKLYILLITSLIWFGTLTYFIHPTFQLLPFFYWVFHNVNARKGKMDRMSSLKKKKVKWGIEEWEEKKGLMVEWSTRNSSFFLSFL